MSLIPRADGPDISRHNPVPAGGFDLIPQYRLFVTKATGTSTIADRAHVDPTFHENWRQMRRRDFEFRGCYHWLRPDIPIADQVKLLYDALALHGGLKESEFVMLDWERTPGLNVPSVAQVEEWLALAERHWPGRLAVYSAEWVPGFIEWRSKPQWLNFPLFYANYNLTHETRNGWIKTAQYNADVWQWTSSHPIPGVDDPTCDMNHVLNWDTLKSITKEKEPMLYPNGYGTAMVTLDQMRKIHEPRMHPEFARPFFAFIEAKGGTLGVGGGWRSTPSSTSPASLRGESFHQNQRWASGFVGYASVDLVHVNPGKVHRAPTWAETEDAPKWGLHTFIPGEPWHIQPIGLRGWKTWVDAGRPDPPRFALPGETQPPTIPEEEVDDMLIGYVKHPDNDAVYRQWSNGTKTLVTGPDELNVHAFVRGKPIEVQTMPDNAWMRATGVIVGPLPPGVNVYGEPV